MVKKDRRMGRKELNQLTETVIGAAIEVHRELGPGLLESVYEECLAREFSEAGISFQRQPQIKIDYKGQVLDAMVRPDFVVKDTLIVEIKAVEEWNKVFEAQLLTYMKLCKCELGLLLNFNVPVLRQGIKRMIL